MKNLPYHPNIDYILCSTVRDELMNRKDKISNNTIKQMAPVDSRLLYKCFSNQNCLADRLRNIGFQEYNCIRSETSCEEIDSPTYKSGTKNDQSILEAYSEFVGVGKKVIFLSRDNETIRMMKGENSVVPFLIEQYHLREKGFTAYWDNCFELLYILGILFGMIVLHHPCGMIVELQAVWRNKDAQDWENELIKIKIKNNNIKDTVFQSLYNDLKERLTKNLLVLDKLGN